MRHRWWLPPLIAVFAILGLLCEIAVLVWISDLIGFWPTVILVILTTCIGIWLTIREGVKTWRSLFQSLAVGRLPTGALAEAALVMLGGVFLVLPGFLGDAIGLLLILPLTRPLVRSALGFIARRVVHSKSESVVIAGEIVPDNPASEDDPPG